MRVMGLVFEKKRIFLNNVYSGKINISQDLFFLFSFYFIYFFNAFFTFESCLSLIMTSGSQLKVKIIKYIILIVLAGCFIINIPYHLNM